MKKCAYCGARIFLGGVRDGQRLYCNAGCRDSGNVQLILDDVPENLVQDYIAAVHSGRCPKCQGPGPVDVHTSYWACSVIVLTFWGKTPRLCCRSCGVKAKLWRTFLSFLFGWWGVPFGLVLTPIQLLRNFFGLFVAPDPSRPSEKMRQMLRKQLATDLAAKARQSACPG